MTTWKYLNSPPFAWRHVLAAHYLKGFDTIIEIGSFKQPINKYLTHEYSKCLCVDPLMDPYKDEKIEHIQGDYRDVDFEPYQGRFALVLIGLYLPVDKKLFDLINAASLVVVDVPTDYLQSKILFQLICDFSIQSVTFQMKCDVSENEFGDLSDSFPVYPKREFYVLEPASLSCLTKSRG